MLSLKGRENEIELCFEKQITLDEAKQSLLNLKKENGNFFEKGDIKVAYSGTEFKYNEELEFSEYLKELFGNDVKLIKKHRLSTVQIEYSLEKDEKITLVINKSLRSGETAISRGDVIIYGDVNPGATVTAKGNITVLGTLRGNAFAAEGGRVFALNMQPSQIRIGKVYSYNKKAENVKSAYAIAENDEIILQCL